MSEQTALYRAYDSVGGLLYVGISNHFGRRWEQHAKVQPWWPKVHRQTVEWHPDRDAAHVAEVAAIEAEHPRFNVMHAPHPEKARAKHASSPGPSTLRLDTDIRDGIDVYAKKTRRTRNATVNHLLEVALDHLEANDIEGTTGER